MGNQEFLGGGKKSEVLESKEERKYLLDLHSILNTLSSLKHSVNSIQNYPQKFNFTDEMKNNCSDFLSKDYFSMTEEEIRQVQEEIASKAGLN